jgi:hypothetical protein
MLPEEDDIAMVLDATLPQTPRMYGSIVYLSRLPRHIGATHSFDTQYGLLVLEIQQSIYSFLLRSVRQILHDISPADFTLPTSIIISEHPIFDEGSFFYQVFNH